MEVISSRVATKMTGQKVPVIRRLWSFTLEYKSGRFK